MEEFIEDINAASATNVAQEINKGASENVTSALGAINNSSSTETTNVNDQSGNNTDTHNTQNADSDQNISSPSVEELATQLGWRKDHQGEDAVDAVTYILRSKDIQKSMSKHNKDLKDQLANVQGSINSLKEHNERVYQADVKRLTNELDALKKERRAAVELADVNKVEELDTKIEDIKKDLNVPKPKVNNEAPVSNPEYEEWIKDNSWYLTDPEMAKFAEKVALQYEGAPLNRIYTIVRNKVEEVFPEKFTSKVGQTKGSNETKPVGPTSPVERSSNKGASPSFTEADLTPEQRDIMNQFVRSKIMTKEQYIADIAKMQN